MESTHEYREKIRRLTRERIIWFDTNSGEDTFVNNYEEYYDVYVYKKYTDGVNNNHKSLFFKFLKQ